MSRRNRAPFETTVQIADLLADGSGRGWVDGREVRLRLALPGETVSGIIRKRDRSGWAGDAVAIQARSGSRVPVPCKVAARCGGCAFQHLAPAAERAFKSAQLERALADGGISPAEVMPPVQSPLFGYRRKARLGVRRVGAHVFVGFREAFSGRVVDMTDCTVLEPRLARLIAPLRQLIAQTSVAGAIPQVEVAAGDDTEAIVLRHLEPLNETDQGLLRRFADTTGAAVWLQPGGPDSLSHFAGSDADLGYANPDFGLLFRFGPLDFVQVNAAINRALVRAAVSALRGSGAVMDLFCGLGNFSLAVARAGHRVSGLEAGDGAVLRARNNARLNGLTARTSFAAVDLYGPAAAVLSHPPDCDALLLDPPRSGAGPNLRSWLAPGIRKVVYVSCNPLSFAADAAVLRDAGFRLQQVGIFDMFPQTAHVETFGVFERAR